MSKFKIVLMQGSSVILETESFKPEETNDKSTIYINHLRNASDPKTTGSVFPLTDKDGRIHIIPKTVMSGCRAIVCNEKETFSKGENSESSKESKPKAGRGRSKT